MDEHVGWHVSDVDGGRTDVAISPVYRLLGSTVPRQEQHYPSALHAASQSASGSFSDDSSDTTAMRSFGDEGEMILYEPRSQGLSAPVTLYESAAALESHSVVDTLCELESTCPRRKHRSGAQLVTARGTGRLASPRRRPHPLQLHARGDQAANAAMNVDDRVNPVFYSPVQGTPSPISPPAAVGDAPAARAGLDSGVTAPPTRGPSEATADASSSASGPPAHDASVDAPETGRAAGAVKAPTEERAEMCAGVADALPSTAEGLDPMCTEAYPFSPAFVRERVRPATTPPRPDGSAWGPTPLYSPESRDDDTLIKTHML